MAGAGGGGGNTRCSGGGFSSGGSEPGGDGGTNGLAGLVSSSGGSATSGSYFQQGNDGFTSNRYNQGIGFVGGTECDWIDSSCEVGSGGVAGSGGNVIVYGDIIRIHAYNGSYITDEGRTIDQTDTWKQENQSIIYAQIGYNLEDLRNDTEEVEYIYTDMTYTYEVPIVSEIISRTAEDLIAELGDSYRSIDYSTYTLYGSMGIGSGAGCIEVSNGTLTIN